MTFVSETTVILDYNEGPLSVEYKAVRAAMLAKDKTKFWEAIEAMKEKMNDELNQKLSNCNADVKRDLQTRIVLSNRKTEDSPSKSTNIYNDF